MKFNEGRTKLMGRESTAGVRRRERREAREASDGSGNEKVADGDSNGVAELPR